MPVHFKCGVCGGLLKVGSRKIGQSVDCPKCKAKVVVPATDVLSGAEVPAKPARKASERAVAANRSGAVEPAGEPWADEEDSETGDVRHPEFVVYDHPPDALPHVDEPPLPAAVPAAVAVPAAKPPAAASVPPTAAAAPALSVSPASPALSVAAPAPAAGPAAVSVAPAAGPGVSPATAASSEEAATLSVAPAAANAPVVLPTPLIGFPTLPTAMADPAAVNSAAPSPAAAANPVPASPAAKPLEPAAAAPEAAPKGKSPAGSPAPAAASIAPQSSSRFVPPSHMILLSRAFFGTIILSLLLLAVFTFLLGLVMGGRYAPAVPPPPPPAPITKQVMVEGRLVYQPFQGRKVGDAGSVVVVLPAAAGPGEPISAEALVPGASEEAFRAAEAALRGRGGGAALCDGEGRFLLNLPAQGTYRMLCVSKKVRLPAPPPAEAIAALEPYFSGAAGRLAGRAVKWSLLQADSDHVSVKPADFGLEER